MEYPSPVCALAHKQIEIESEGQAALPYYLPSLNDFEASTSTSTAADNTQNRCKNYGHDVFISHRGPDVKKTFASHLYRRLGLHGVRAFLDYQEMQEGEKITDQIKDAIATAVVHVAIFSPGYVDSRWCLDELLHMLERKAPIIPVFYNVKPDDLRWTEGKDGVYARAFQKQQMKTKYDSETHQEKPRYDSNTIKDWREALASVSEISGFELDAYNGDEGELLDKVVERLLKLVKREGLYVAKYPTGLDTKLKHFDHFLSQLDKAKPRVAGIVGLGGTGKTTFAKEFFNRKRSYYHKSCFLSGVRDAAKSGESSLVGLQRKLLQSLFGFDKLIDSPESKGKLITNFQFFSQSLLILDDVDHGDQLDALLPGEIKDTLYPNCLILIISRDKNVLVRSGIQDSSIYKLSGLNTKHSTELFCRHAFGQPYPLPGFQYLVENILRVCNGLPLSLKVLGGHFCGNRDASYWEDELNRLHYGLPDIQHTLKISYDSLDKEEKQIFLDIACFLTGVKRDTAIKLWDQTGSKGFLVFQNLKNKSLVEVDDENCIQMHDHLRELGREIAKDSGFHIPYLWDRTDSVNIGSMLQMLKQSSQQEITNVRGIRMVPGADIGNDMFKYYASLSSEIPWFEKSMHALLRNCTIKLCNRRHNSITMSNLQVLVAEDHLLESILRMARLPNLRWLRWYKCGHSSLPSWIPMEKLRVLHVVGGALKILWQNKAQAPLDLRELEIWAPLSKLPKSIGQLKHLEQVYISLPDENNMRSLPKEFCLLSSLKRFELINARKMKSLPALIGNLTRLEHFNLSFCWSLERLPDSFENLINLTYLDLRGTHRLIISTKSLGNIPSHDDFNHPREVRAAKEERERVEGGKVELLPFQLPCSIQELHTAELPNFIENLCNLEVLELKNSSLKKLPPSLSDLMNLKELRLVECERLKCLRLVDCEKLTKLEVDSCHDLVDVGTLPNTLVQLNMISCPNLKKIDGLCGLAKLQMLNISKWTEVEELASIETLVSLEELRASRCKKLKRIRGLSQLTKLRLLDVSGCNVLEELEGVEHLRSLEKLDASDCRLLQWDESILEQLPQQLKEGMLYI